MGNKIKVLLKKEQWENKIYKTYVTGFAYNMDCDSEDEEVRKWYRKITDFDFHVTQGCTEIHIKQEPPIDIPIVFYTI